VKRQFVKRQPEVARAAKGRLRTTVFCPTPCQKRGDRRQRRYSERE
jgi:hypothetical protein